MFFANCFHTVMFLFLLKLPPARAVLTLKTEKTSLSNRAFRFQNAQKQIKMPVLERAGIILSVSKNAIATVLYKGFLQLRLSRGRQCPCRWDYHIWQS